jgi:hypothetical protein
LSIRFQSVTRIVELIVIKTHISRALARTHDDRTLHAGAGSGGGRSSAIIRRMSAKRYRGMAKLQEMAKHRAAR